MTGSPTIDQGTASTSNLGALDLDGEARSQGGAPDIGADEFTVSPPAGPLLPPRGTADPLSARARGKKLIVLLRCTAAGGCPFNEIVIRTARKVDLGKLAATTKAKRILLAKGNASLEAGETQAVRLKLRKQGRRLFRARRKVPAKATSIGAAGTVTESFKVKRK